MKVRVLFIASAAIALNLTLGKIASTLSLPVYIDCIGTVLAGAMLPLFPALSVGLGTSLIAGVIINPFYPPFAGTQAAIALVSFGLAHAGAFRRWWTSLIAGYVIALTAVVVSAPVTVVLFGGVTQSGTTGINAVLLATGKTVWQSVLGGSFLVESIDKPTAALITFFILQRLPAYMKSSENPASGTAPGESTSR